ncbi:MAG: hypothetical protein ACFWT0_09055 [Bifidobacterium crudilactis]
MAPYISGRLSLKNCCVSCPVSQECPASVSLTVLNTGNQNTVGLSTSSGFPAHTSTRMRQMR